ncbi:FtsX-like permease family protein [Halogeometricum borinquense]|uniref:FtsX-like permease family protein n=1 Tax=Halogeometricum borinquense TaxID=60847 RepID=A0A482T7M3_9EURY|nr:FtsX-like permease family protein [Halogeometricum borinquense]RYJ08625.1 FtsX-like permease family protein [Halogeometricum borinquense]
MRFESTLLSSWSRREWLSVAVIAVTTAFLIGSAVLLLTVGSYTSTLEGDLESASTATYYESHDAAVAATDTGDLVFPLIRVDIDGHTRTVVGIPPDAPPRIEEASVAWQPATVPSAPDEGLYGPVPRTTQLPVGTTDTTVSPHPPEQSIFPAEWYVGSADTVTSLGASGALVIEAGGEPAGIAQWQEQGAPLIGALPFLVSGLGQVIRTLTIAAVGGGLLILVVVYNVTRMSIRDRHPEIRVARATGISPIRLFAVLQGRVLGLVGTGVILGFAIGLITTKAVINAATYAGLPVTIRAVVTSDILWAVLQIGGFLLGMGVLAGVLASVPVVRGSPATIGRSTNTTQSIATRVRERLSLVQPTFVDWRAVVPTTTTVAVFVLVILLTTAIGGALAPLATTSSGTVTEAGITHPLNSRISEEYASVLRSQNITASPEVLYAQTRNGEPYLARGANYTAFSAVSNTTVVEGRTPAAYDEAVIGTSLADTLDVSVGETITVGGSVTPGVRRLTIVGRFSGDGITDDQLLIPLQTGQQLATDSKTVHLIRTNGDTLDFERFAGQSSGIVVTELSGSSSVEVNHTYTLTVRGENLGKKAATRNVTVRADNRTRSRTLSVGPGESGAADVGFTFAEPGTHTITAAEMTKSVEVFSPRTLRLPAKFPRRAPPGSTLIVPATTRNETPVTGATVTLGDRQGTTNEQGTVLMRVPTEPGEYTLTIEKQNYTSERRTLVVEEDAPQRLIGRLQVSPQRGTRLTKPEVTVQLANPWGQFFVRNVSLVTPAETEHRTVEMTGGNITQIRIPASDAGLDDSLTPGTYDLRLVSDETVLATTTYRVTGDERVTATLASQGEYSQGTAINHAIESVFGNVRVLFLVMIALAGVSTVGGTAATFAHAVHANRRRIGIFRATGASRRQLLGILAVDAVKLSLPAIAIAFGTAFTVIYVLARSDVLVIFGIKLHAPQSVELLFGTGLGALALAIGSALGVGYAFLSHDPERLLRTER